MESPLCILTVSLGPRSYPVYIGENILPKVGYWMLEAHQRGRAAIVTDDAVAALYGPAIVASLTAAGYDVSTHVVKRGEKSKSLANVEMLAESLAHAGVDRHGSIVAVGGGVVGDLAGFVAAIYYRGIPYIQVPTTIMAQVDSSVGGKTAVNLSAGKNLVGSFHQPLAVIADTATLKTLGRREWNEGFAEVIKYGVIRDRALLEELAKPETPPVAELIQRCLTIKAAIVASDERETLGARALLNFGHTLGHAIEAAAGYGRMLHGEAVSLGMMAAAWLSVRRAGLAPEELVQLQRLLAKFQLPTTLPRACPKKPILHTVLADKKFVERHIRVVLTPKLGTAVLADWVTKEDLELALDALAESNS
ncbi:MAG: 3-dehydroquinate synthase [Chthoniobacterales bacterium]